MVTRLLGLTFGMICFVAALMLMQITNVPMLIEAMQVLASKIQNPELAQNIAWGALLQEGGKLVISFVAFVVGGMAFTGKK